jgi:tripartite-type tricarboxylate transporter receptor subunit TctC
MMRDIPKTLMQLFFLVNSFFLVEVFAQNYPTKPITLICPFNAGGSADIIARIVAKHLSEDLKVPVIVENHGGSGSAIGSNMVAKAKPDGYTILLLSGAYSAQAAITTAPKFDPIKDIAMVSLITTYPFVMAVNNNSPYYKLQDLINDAKAHPGKLNYSSSGVGSIHHLSSELLNVSSNIDSIHIPTKGGTIAVTELIGERIDFLLEAPQLIMPYIQSGKLRGIATTGTSRSTKYGNLPTIGETLPGYEVRSYIGIATTGGTPSAIIDILSKAMRSTISNKAISQRLIELGGDPVWTTPEETKQFVAGEYNKWLKVISVRDIKKE